MVIAPLFLVVSLGLNQERLCYIMSHCDFTGGFNFCLLSVTGSLICFRSLNFSSLNIDTCFLEIFLD